MNIIRHVMEPEKLFLVWKPPLALREVRSNLAVGEIDREGVLTYLTDTDDYKKAIQQGFTGYPAFPLKSQTHTHAIRAFLRRIPPRNRSDFGEFLAHFRLPEHENFSDFSLLANTGGKLPKDGFSVIPDLQQVEPPCELLMEVAGFRHTPACKSGYRPPVDAEAQFQAEPTNPYDRDAVQVFVDGHLVGYVNRLQANALKKWLDAEKHVVARVDRVNGTSDRPVICLFLEAT